MSLRLPAFAFLALGLQLLVIYAGFGELTVLRRFLLPLSYLLVFAFIWANRWQLGILIIGLGAFLNFLAIVSNGGLMPLDPDTVERAGQLDKIEDVRIGEAVPRSKDVLLRREDTRLWPLSDVLTVDNPLRLYAFSVGDVIIGAGLAVTVTSYLLPRRSQLDTG
ncbi:MAG TPA: DUF5317 domain-containing protein [Dehalococcoidia bacterium]|nr:DUF5317 domain-containing protein [Dehalococcoidia bacterium]